jgi:hypothetical protein
VRDFEAQLRNFEKLRAVTSPNFYSAIAIDDAAKRDYSGAIDNFTRELRAPVNVRATQWGMELDDTYRLAQAYEDQTPADLKNAGWFYTRAAQYAPPKTKPQWEAKAESTYLDYHGSMNGYPEMQALAKGVPAVGILSISRHCFQVTTPVSSETVMAEREGFEPPIPVKVCLISSQVHSTALPSLRVFVFNYLR